MLSLMSQRFAGRVLVRAFTTSYTLPAARTLATANSNVGGAGVPRFLSTNGVSVEEDLDAALDNILGDAFSAADEATDLANGADMNGSTPAPKELLEEVSERILY